MWGDNENLNQGLHIQSNFVNFYSLDKTGSATSNQQNLNPDRALHDLLCLSKQQTKSNDDLVYFQALLSKWSDTLLAQRSSSDQLSRLQSQNQLEYKRIVQHNRPTIMMCMLNTHVQQIKANRRLALCGTPDGRVFALGKDFRNLDGNQPSERVYGVPRQFSMPIQV